MKNPLKKRLLRELTGDIGKYIVIFVLLVFSIGFVSGFIVAGESMIRAYNESFEKYSIEDGNFRTEEALSTPQKQWIEKKGISVYENFYVEKDFEICTDTSDCAIYLWRDGIYHGGDSAQGCHV